MTTPTPRTDAVTHAIGPDGFAEPSHDGRWVHAAHARQLETELAHYATAAEELRQELNEQASQLAKRDALIQRILEYPYLPQKLATIIRKELDK